MIHIHDAFDTSPRRFPLTGITVTAVPEGAMARFALVDSLNMSLKASVPAVGWCRNRRAWVVEGPQAFASLCRWAQACEEEWMASARGPAPGKDRFLARFDWHVEAGKYYRVHGEIVLVTRLGRTFPCPNDAPALHGSAFCGHEGRPVRYAYYRSASPSEAAAFEQRIADAKQVLAEFQAAKFVIGEAIAEIKKRGNRLALHLGSAPGVALWMDERFEINRGGGQLRLSCDHLWYVEGSEADIERGRVNIPNGASAWCLSADDVPELASRIRAAAAAYTRFGGEYWQDIVDAGSLTDGH